MLFSNDKRKFHDGNKLSKQTPKTDLGVHQFTEVPRDLLFFHTHENSKICFRFFFFFTHMYIYCVYVCT